MSSNNILSTLAFLIAVGIFFVYVNPTWTGEIATARAAINADNQALAAANEYTAQENELESAKNTIDPENLAHLSAFLPDSVDNVGLILDLNALAARNGLSLSNIDVQANLASASASSNNPNAVPIMANQASSADLSLSAVGTYSALQNFLKGIEKSVRLLDVKDIVIEGSDTGVYTYKMKLRL